MLVSETPLKNRLEEVPDYCGAVSVSSHSIRILNGFRTNYTSTDQALNQLRRLRLYFRDDNPCFLDYLQIRGKTGVFEYTETLRQVDSAFDSAKEELIERKPGRGIDRVIEFAKDLSEVCSSQTKSIRV